MPTFIGNDDANAISGTALADSIFGRSGDDRIFGDDGNDFLNGGASADYLTGGAGNDFLLGDENFRFSAGSGSDTIGDFLTTNDKIGINVPGIDDFGDLAITEDAAGNAIVQWNDGAGIATIKLVSVAMSSLSSEDFVFDF